MLWYWNGGLEPPPRFNYREWTVLQQVRLTCVVVPWDTAFLSWVVLLLVFVLFFSDEIGVLTWFYDVRVTNFHFWGLVILKVKDQDLGLVNWCPIVTGPGTWREIRSCTWYYILTLTASIWRTLFCCTYHVVAAIQSITVMNGKFDQWSCDGQQQAVAALATFPTGA